MDLDMPHISLGFVPLHPCILCIDNGCLLSPRLGYNWLSLIKLHYHDREFVHIDYVSMERFVLPMGECSRRIVELDQINLFAYVNGVIHHYITVEEEQ